MAARVFSILLLLASIAVGDDGLMKVGIAGHAFDHLGGIGDQAPAAVASGANIIYCTGIGTLGYQGLPAPDKLKTETDHAASYIAQAKANGIRLAIGYVCATSIVNLDAFDKNWPTDFRAKFSTPPASWLQRGADGKPLASWYGGDYRPACMNNPDWRTYEKEIVRRQIEIGCDGVFFDNPTVHTAGCYCDHCMKRFAAFVHSNSADPSELRQFAVVHRVDFARFRCTIAADFLAEMREYARSIKPGALITCNNSLNMPDQLYAQCRSYAYNINNLSAVEDLVVVEDMATQPRMLHDGTFIEYGPVYELLRSISHNKPVVACTIADGDYHTPPNLMRLAMAEAAAHGASYLSWPTWPENVRGKMIAAVHPEADFLKRSADLLIDTEAPADVVLFFPFRQWETTASCPALQIARDLSRANIQFKAIAEENFSDGIAQNSPAVLAIQSREVLTPAEFSAVDQYQKQGGKVIYCNTKTWLADLTQLAKPTITLIDSHPSLRLVVRRQPEKMIVHVLNLGIERLSSFTDQVHPVENIHLSIRCPGELLKSINAISADQAATIGQIPFTVGKSAGETIVNFTIPRVEISTILVINR